jgi:hypothetical protein
MKDKDAADSRMYQPRDIAGSGDTQMNPGSMWNWIMQVLGLRPSPYEVWKKLQEEYVNK